MDTQLISTPLQTSECDLERIHSDETVSSDSIQEPESLEYPTFLAIDIGDPRTSDADIRAFLKSLTTYMQDTKLTSQLLHHLLVPLRSLLIRDLKSLEPFSTRMYHAFWKKNPINLLGRQQLAIVQHYDLMLALLVVIRYCAVLRQGQNELIVFLMGVMQEVWEERRREGLVLDGPVPLFVSTPLRPNMTPPEMVPLLDSANDFLASTRPLSDSDAIPVTFFLISLDNIIFIQTEKGRDVFNSAFVASLSSCPPFARSVATLILLSLTCSHLDIRKEHRKFWLDCIFAQQENVMSAAKSGLFAVLVGAAQTLQTGWSDENILDVHSFFTDIVELSVRMIAPWRSTLKTDSDIEQFQHDQQLVVSNVLVPLRQSLVLFARTNTRIVPHFRLLSYPDINHPDTVGFFSGVWEEVRQEAIEVVCGEDESEAPVFLTMDLFSRLSMEETELGLSSLSSYLSTTPSPPPPVASSIRLFLLTIATISSLSLSEQKKIRARSPWAQIDSQLQVWIRSHRSFAHYFAEFVPTLLLASRYDDDVQSHLEWILESVMVSSSNSSEIILSLTDAGLFSNMALVLRTKIHSNSRFAISSDNIRCFLVVVDACLSIVSTSFCESVEDQPREDEHRAHILIEKVLVASQPFLMSLLPYLSVSRYITSVIYSLTELLRTIGHVEWHYPSLSESLAKCGLHVATMRFCDLTERTEILVWPLILFAVEEYHYGLINARPFMPNTGNSASSKLALPTLRERMKGRNEEGQEDLIEKILLGRVLGRDFSEGEPPQSNLSLLLHSALICLLIQRILAALFDETFQSHFTRKLSFQRKFIVFVFTMIVVVEVLESSTVVPVCQSVEILEELFLLVLVHPSWTNNSEESRT
ncbi:hypothetical protein BLNAU_8413 [Blattamonas nauphoetae]|uniref:Uncharacterized protein n=1 Tax=Blattamonas nauphoetae TaxID=2049346 RepID=A0ABQ9XYM4_9EUKA|nr:hypothetical protein BLNAU_8413 [Blattamonas nauphoetae]